jgi:hypothetical protein
MASVLPGMDPYLEDAKRWPTFHGQFISALGDALQPALNEKYRLRIGHRHYEIEQVLFTSIQKEEHQEPFLEIRQKGSGDKLVTLIELISPVNRTHPVGRKRYEARREEARQDGAHLVELDLVLQGTTCLEADLSTLSESQYVCSVTRHVRPVKHELYGNLISKRLPRVRLPMMSEDRDLVLDVQALINRVYDRCFEGMIDYQYDPHVPLNDADRYWLDQLLRSEKLRK